MMRLANYTNEEVRDMLEDFRNNNFKPDYKLLAHEIGINYHHFIQFKNNKLDMSDRLLEKVVVFIEDNS